MNEIFIAAGGDRRLSAAASYFEEKGCTVERVLGCGFDDIGNVIPADHLILPMPVTTDKRYGGLMDRLGADRARNTSGRADRSKA